MTPKCTPTLVVTFMEESRIFRTLIEKEKKTPNWAFKYHWKGLEV
jgi:hypothetical protein